jgi:succinyl-CoA synthetase beta subunit
LKLFEYEAKEIFAKRHIPVPEGFVCENKDNIRTEYDNLDGKAVLKAQVLVGGRGKAGGIMFPKHPKEAAEMGESLLGMKINGELVKKVLVERAFEIEEEYYLGVVTDTDEGCVRLMFSSEGGMDVEALVREKPESIKMASIDPHLGLLAHQVRNLLIDLDIPREYQQSITRIALTLFSLYWDMDGILVEINPLVVTRDKKILAADAKFNIDNNALYRQPGIPKRPIETVEDRAAAASMTFIGLDGDIGIISNGAGLTMATMDLIQLYGGRPANFLDGKDALSKEGFRIGLELILENPRVNSILVNIFAGGPRCDEIARKIVDTLHQLEQDKTLKAPLVVTLHGRYVEEGRKILSQCQTPYFYQELEIEGAVRKAITLRERIK